MKIKTCCAGEDCTNLHHKQFYPQSFSFGGNIHTQNGKKIHLDEFKKCFGENMQRNELQMRVDGVKLFPIKTGFPINK